MLQKQQLVKTKHLAELENQETHIEKMTLTISQEIGYSLQTINLLVKEVRMMQAEKASYERKVNDVMEKDQKFISEGHFNSDMNNLTGLQDPIEIKRHNHGMDNLKHLAERKAYTGSYEELKPVTLPEEIPEELPHYDLRSRQSKFNADCVKCSILRNI